MDTVQQSDALQQEGGHSWGTAVPLLQQQQPLGGCTLILQHFSFPVL